MRDPAQRRKVRHMLVAALVVIAGWWLLQQGSTPDPGEGVRTEQSASDVRTAAEVDPESGLPVVAPADLPPEARETIELIEQGGPFPYTCCDDTTFRNDEGLLPDHPRGYYREYTVETPGSPDRGARRIVVGDQGELYWTDDHYESFDRIDLDRSGDLP